MKVTNKKGNTFYCLNECIFDPSHRGNESAIVQQADGRLVYQCYHDSCKDKTWKDARQLISKDAKLTQFMKNLQYDNAILKKLNENKNKTFTAAELYRRNIGPARYAVKKIIPEGLTLLCGNPKTGKSYLSLDIAVSIVEGKMIFGQIPVDQGAVLYLALEDGERRLQERLLTVGGKIANEDDLHFSTTWDCLDEGGKEKLIEKIDEIDNLKLVIIDTLGKIRPASAKKDLYQQDYKIIGNLKDIADHFKVPMVVVHHMRKMGSEDIFEKVSGTYGLTGAADTILVLDRKRESDLASLKITGRDIEEGSYSLKFEKENCTWKFTDEVVDKPQLNGMSGEVVELINNNNGSMESKDIVSNLTKKGHKESSVRWWLSELVKKKILSRDGRGVYKTHQQTNNTNILDNTNITNKANITNKPIRLNNIGSLEPSPINKYSETPINTGDDEFICNIGNIGDVSDSNEP